MRVTTSFTIRNEKKTKHICIKIDGFIICSMASMAIGVVEFSRERYKIRKVFA